MSVLVLGHCILKLHFLAVLIGLFGMEAETCDLKGPIVLIKFTL